MEINLSIKCPYCKNTEKPKVIQNLVICNACQWVIKDLDKT
jgi:ribosomal protein L37AE/L43A